MQSSADRQSAMVTGLAANSPPRPKGASISSIPPPGDSGPEPSTPINCEAGAPQTQRKPQQRPPPQASGQQAQPLRHVSRIPRRVGANQGAPSPAGSSVCPHASPKIPKLEAGDPSLDAGLFPRLRSQGISGQIRALRVLQCVSGSCLGGPPDPSAAAAATATTSGR